MQLRDARVEFTRLLTLLIMEMWRQGVRPAFAEGMDRRTAKDPTTDHMKNSLHEIGLAQDIDLYDVDGNYLSHTEDHAAFGEFWEGLSSFCHWGGKWGDGNHYSMSDSSIPGCLTSLGILRK